MIAGLTNLQVIKVSLKLPVHLSPNICLHVGGSWRIQKDPGRQGENVQTPQTKDSGHQGIQNLLAVWCYPLLSILVVFVVHYTTMDNMSDDGSEDNRFNSWLVR